MIFSSQGKSPLLRLYRTIDQREFIQVLKNYVVLFRKQLFSGPLGLIHEIYGCEAHPAKSVSAFLEVENTEALPWPVRSSDLNPIVHVWAIMKRRFKE